MIRFERFPSKLRSGTPALSGPASKVAIAPGGQKAAIIGQDGQVSVIDLATGRRMVHIDAHFNAVLRIAWSADGQRIATGTMGQGFGLDARNLEDVRVIAAEGSPVSQEVRFSPDSRFLGRLLTGARRLVIHRITAQSGPKNP